MCSSHTHWPWVTTNQKPWFPLRNGWNTAITQGLADTMSQYKPIETSVLPYIWEHEKQSYMKLSSASDRYNYIVWNVTKAFTDKMSNAYAVGDSQLFHSLWGQMTATLTTIRNDIFSI